VLGVFGWLVLRIFIVSVTYRYYFKNEKNKFKNKIV
jgi:hypothetical protein